MNFEPVASIVGDDDDYGVSYAAFRKLGTEFSDAYLEIDRQAVVLLAGYIPQNCPNLPP